jgi:hypothetical protein
MPSSSPTLLHMNRLNSMKLTRIFAVVCFIVITAAAFAASPCAGVNRNLTPQRKAVVAPEIAKQLHFKSVDVLQSLQFGSWTIFYVNTDESDEMFVFYADDPLRSRYITLWSGAVVSNEEEAISAWTLKNAPGIPRRLATCFAWHVTKARDQ